jgi:DNA-binding transcriptional MerR regulator
MSEAGFWVQTEIDLGLSAGEPDTSADAEAVYGAAEVCRYTGLSHRQLDHWATHDIFVPSVQTAAGSGTSRLYSFRDILALRVLKRLSGAGISVRNVSRAVETLRHLGDGDLTSTVLVSDGVTVYECRSDDEVIDLLRGGQGVFAVVLSHALRDLRSALRRHPVNSRRRARAAA